MPILTAEAAEVAAYIAVDYLHVLVLGGWAGVARYYQNCRQKNVKCQWFNGGMEVFISMLVGVLTFLLCEWQGVDRILSAVIVTVGAYGGADVLHIADRFLKDYLKGKLDKYGDRNG